ncbi:MAG: electron transfer flavoprotein subunit beta/FixA family protein [Candidatus Kariarchaeaceae archaeon]
MDGLNIVVLVKVVPKPEEVKMDPETNTLDRRDAESIINPPDKNAIETAVALKERFGGKVTLMSMAPPFVDDFIRLMLAMGCDDAILLSDRSFAMADTYPTTMVLAEGIKKMDDPVDLVICGTESADGGTGNVPPGLAEWLDFSQATYCEKVDYDTEEGRYIIERATSSGLEIITIPKPAVLSVELAANSPRFPDFDLKRTLDAEHQLKIWDNKILKLDPEIIGLNGSMTLVEGMVAGKSRERKKEIIEGDLDAMADKIVDLIMKSL